MIEKQNKKKINKTDIKFTTDRKDVTESLKQQVLPSVDVRDGWMW